MILLTADYNQVNLRTFQKWEYLFVMGTMLQRVG